MARTSTGPGRLEFGQSEQQIEACFLIHLKSLEVVRTAQLQDIRRGARYAVRTLPAARLEHPDGIL